MKDISMKTRLVNNNRKHVLLFSLLMLISINVFAKSEMEVCKKIKNLFISGEFRKYSVPFVQPEPDSLEYEFDLDQNEKKDHVKAYCGNGSDAICEMTLFMNGQKNFDFSLPASIRFIEMDKQIYIVNGVTVDTHNRVEANNYSVHQLLARKLKLICNKY